MLVQMKDKAATNPKPHHHKWTALFGHKLTILFHMHYSSQAWRAPAPKSVNVWIQRSDLFESSKPRPLNLQYQHVPTEKMDTEDHTRWTRLKSAFTKETEKPGKRLIRPKTLNSLDWSPAILFLLEYYWCISVRNVLKIAIIFSWSALLWVKPYGIIL